MSEIKLGSVVKIALDDQPLGDFTEGKEYTVFKDEDGDLAVTDDHGAYWMAVDGCNTFQLASAMDATPSGGIFADQAKLMQGFGCTTSGFNAEQATLYLRLTCEEFCETLCAANPDCSPEIKSLFVQLAEYACVTERTEVVELFDGVVDTIVTAAGVGISAGFPMQAGWDEVLRSNMAKIDPETGLVLRRPDGKVLKGPDWTPPNLADLLAT